MRMKREITELDASRPEAPAQKAIDAWERFVAGVQKAVSENACGVGVEWDSDRSAWVLQVESWERDPVVVAVPGTQTRSTITLRMSVIAPGEWTVEEVVIAAERLLLVFQGRCLRHRGTDA